MGRRHGACVTQAPEIAIAPRGIGEVEQVPAERAAHEQRHPTDEELAEKQRNHHVARLGLRHGHRARAWLSLPGRRQEVSCRHLSITARGRSLPRHASCTLAPSSALSTCYYRLLSVPVEPNAHTAV